MIIRFPEDALKTGLTGCGGRQVRTGKEPRSRASILNCVRVLETWRNPLPVSNGKWCKPRIQHIGIY